MRILGSEYDIIKISKVFIENRKRSSLFDDKNKEMSKGQIVTLVVVALMVFGVVFYLVSGNRPPALSPGDSSGDGVPTGVIGDPSASEPAAREEAPPPPGYLLHASAQADRRSGSRSKNR